MIISAVPEVRVVGANGRRSAFEITVNGILIFSKLERGSFPDPQSVVEQVVAASKNEQVTTVEKTEKTCTIL
ncbi:migration and invasion enhancer 1-like [Tachypleus tridentatus]|uniref:migration and invasion enhancer 1-like n=1 Tax=Tachypleus tridentatus TaxID=6853 RepID=UPI003FD4EE6B